MKIRNGLLVGLGFVAWAGSALAAPITDFITVDGTDWAQVDLFTHLTWNQINAECPSGVCVNGAMLKGYEMDGWVWASVDEMSSLLNVYLSNAGVTGSDLLGPGGDELTQSSSTWAPAFLTDFRPLRSFSHYKALEGLLYTTAPLGVGQFRATDGISSPVESDRFITHTTNVHRDAFVIWGAAFYRVDVPAPATLGLFGLALAGLGWTRRRKA